MAKKKQNHNSASQEEISQPLPEILGQIHVLEKLKNYHDSPWSGGTLLFAGPQGVGKKTTASRFAMGLLCKEHVFLGCGRCPPCRWGLTGQHPDLRIMLPPEGKNHPLESVYAFQDWLAFRPWHGNRKIWIWDNAEKMRVEAANALLKSLEEPPSDTLIILVSSQVYRLLPTIRSRSQIHRFGYVPESVLVSSLMSRFSYIEKEARWIARMSEGRPGIAFQPEPYWSFHRALRSRVMKWLHQWIVNPSNGWTAYLEMDLRDLSTMASALNPSPGRLYSADGWVWSRWWVEQVLRHGIAILRDILFLSWGAHRSMVSLDIIPQMERIAKDLPHTWLIQIIQRWIEFLADLQVYNFNGAWHIPALLWPPPPIRVRS